MNEIKIFGYSGHAYVCVEIAELNNYIVRSYYDLQEKITNPYSLKYLGYIENIVFNIPFFIAIGDNQSREIAYNYLKNKNSLFITLLHPKAIISKSVNIGIASVVSVGVFLNRFVQIGTCCIINTGAIIGYETKIGDFVHVAPGVVVGNNVIIGSGTFIGANSVIENGVKIISNIIIGAGTVVVNDILVPGTYLGNPARLLIKN